MLDAISTSISTIALLVQLYDRHGKSKVIELAEYKAGLREIVSSLHFAKNLHAVAHEIADSQCAAIFDANLRNLGVQDFADGYRANLGRIYERYMRNEIDPNLPKYEALITDASEQYPAISFTNQFNVAVGSLTQSYPRMISTYKQLSSGIAEVDQEIDRLLSSVTNFTGFVENYERNRELWKSYITHNNRLLLTLADQTILSQITILDELFVI